MNKFFWSSGFTLVYGIYVHYWFIWDIFCQNPPTNTKVITKNAMSHPRCENWSRLGWSSVRWNILVVFHSGVRILVISQLPLTFGKEIFDFGFRWTHLDVVNRLETRSFVIACLTTILPMPISEFHRFVKTGRRPAYRKTSGTHRQSHTRVGTAHAHSVRVLVAIELAKSVWRLRERDSVWRFTWLSYSVLIKQIKFSPTKSFQSHFRLLWIDTMPWK